MNIQLLKNLDTMISMFVCTWIFSNNKKLGKEKKSSTILSSGFQHLAKNS